MNTHFYTYMLYIFVVKEQNSHFYLGKMKQTTVWKLQVESGKSQTGSQLLCHSRDQIQFVFIQQTLPMHLF